MLRNVYGLRRDEITAQWRRPRCKELHVMYFSPNVILVIKSRRMIRTGRVARIGGRRGANMILVRDT
jgi:hypothetical protein